MTRTGPVDLAKYLREILSGRVSVSEPLAKRTSLRIGGPADLWMEVSSFEELRQVRRCLRQAVVPWVVLGAGTNVLVSDRGFRGGIIHLTKGFEEIRFVENGVVAGGAASLERLGKETAERGLAGLEFTVGIPGTVGGAIAMNAGAAGQAVGDRLRHLRLLERNDEPHDRDGDAFRAAYRDGRLPAESIVCEAEFSLTPEDPETIRKRRTEFSNRRRRQPAGKRSAGCIFKNPRERPAGWLIEQAGLKGWSRGGARVSGEHANYIVNEGGATAEDMLVLINDVRQRVAAKFGCVLELELKVLGPDGFVTV